MPPCQHTPCSVYVRLSMCDQLQQLAATSREPC